MFKPASLASPTLAGDSLALTYLRSPLIPLEFFNSSSFSPSSPHFILPPFSRNKIPIPKPSSLPPSPIAMTEKPKPHQFWNWEFCSFTNHQVGVWKGMFLLGAEIIVGENVPSRNWGHCLIFKHGVIKSLHEST